MASTKISRAFSTATNAKKFTLSVWVKRSKLGAEQQIFSRSTGQAQLYISSADKIQFYDQTSGHNFRTNRLFRDTSAWYHIVVAVDTTQSTASDRNKIYVNGVQETSFEVETNATQNNDTAYNISGITYDIGAYNNSYYWDGYMSHFHFIDGTMYTASPFGETDATTGEWKITTNPSVTYGNNGFFILKDGNSVTDQSGNGNNGTTSGTLTKSEDCPSNIFNVLNRIHPTAGNFTLSNGNTTIYKSGTGQLGGFLGTIMPTTGKWYWEAKITEAANSDRTRVGVANYESVTGTSTIQNNYSGLEVSCKNAALFVVTNGSTSETSASGAYSDGDIVNIAMDLDNKAIYVGRNGTYVTLTGTSGGDPTSGANKTGAIVTDTTHILNGSPMCVYFGHYAGASDVSNVSFNFGNGYFGTTAVSSAGTNASGIGVFEYDVPNGYTALSTKGLNL